MGKGYLTRFKLRQGPPKLNKVVKEVVTAFNNLLEYEIEGATEKEMADTMEFLSDVEEDVSDDLTVENRRKRFLKIVKEIVNNEEPGETDDEEEEQEEEEEETEEPPETENTEESLADNSVAVMSNTKEADESQPNLADASVTAADRTFNQVVKELEDEASEVAKKQASPSLPNMDQTMDLSGNCNAETSVTAADMTMSQLLKTPQPTRNFNPPEESGSRKSQSLASLLTSARSTPLRSIRSASSHSMFAEETLSRRARRSSQDLAQMILYSDCQKTPGNTSGVLEESIVCLGSVKKDASATPEVIIIEDTPPRAIYTADLLSETPKTTSEFAKARARLRRVPDSPLEKEIGKLSIVPEESPRAMTDHTNVSMDICTPTSPSPARLPKSPVEKKAGMLPNGRPTWHPSLVTVDYTNVSMEICTPTPPRPAPSKRHGTPMPFNHLG